MSVAPSKCAHSLSYLVRTVVDPAAQLDIPTGIKLSSEALFTPFGELGSGLTKHIFGLRQGEIRAFGFFASPIVIV